MEKLIKEAIERGFKVGASYNGLTCTTLSRYELLDSGELVMFGKHFKSDDKTTNFSDKSHGGAIFANGEWIKTDTI